MIKCTKLDSNLFRFDIFYYTKSRGSVFFTGHSVYGYDMEHRTDHSPRLWSEVSFVYQHTCCYC